MQSRTALNHIIKSGLAVGFITAVMVSVYWLLHDASPAFGIAPAPATLHPAGTKALIEAHVSAAAGISRLALGHEPGTTRKEYHALPDSQNFQAEVPPFGSRGGLLVHHFFPADGEYQVNWVPVRSNAGGG